MLRNTAPDSLWHLKPLALGLGGAFLFDLYLFAEALLFKNIDADAFVARGFVHAGVVPLIWLSTTRTRDWMTKFRLSQKAAFQSASLLFVGVYLLFMVFPVASGWFGILMPFWWLEEFYFNPGSMDSLKLSI